ncbi:MAG: hypothetical protein RR558_09515, partial [Coprobacillus sp.]
KKLETFKQDKELAHYAMQRQLGRWVVEGEKRLKYEEGKADQKLKDVQAVVQSLYSISHLDWLNCCTYEQLDIIFNQALCHTPLSQIKQSLIQDNV